LWSLAVAFSFASLFALIIAGCGQNNYFANRNLPPSGIANRCLVAIQNPSALAKGSLQILDAYYDIRHAYNSDTTTFFISGYSGADPETIQNLPVQQTGIVYGSGDGSLGLVNYATEKFGSSVSGLSGLSSSVFGAQNLTYYLAANQQVHAFTVLDETTTGGSFALNVPDIYKVSLNASGTVALGFIQNSNAVYSIVHLTSAQQAALEGGPSTWANLYPGNSSAVVQDCEPQNLPVYCAVQVPDPNGMFDRPIKAVFSSDGSTAYVINCGPECGGTQAGIVTVPLTGSAFNTGVGGPAALNLKPTAVVAVPGGATDALQDNNLLYVAGQQLQPAGSTYAGLYAGNLSILDLTTNTVTGKYSISDGNHTKMVLADSNTLWIGSQSCEEGVRYAEAQANPTSAPALGCLTMFNTSNNAVMVDSYKGDLTGLTAITSLLKVYVAEGGQVHIYNTTDGTERDNSNVTVIGTAYDVAYMDAVSDGDNANY
jgi:hypothetical protein